MRSKGNRMKKHALLIQAHQDISYFIKLAKIQPNVNFYVHMDANPIIFLTLRLHS